MSLNKFKMDTLSDKHDKEEVSLERKAKRAEKEEEEVVEKKKLKVKK